MRNIWKWLMVFTAMVALVTGGAYAISKEDSHPNILLLNSYHDGYVWSNQTKKGVQDVLDVHFDSYTLRIEHMDTKNNSSETYMQALFDMYRVKYGKDKFDLIVCADDNALKFLLKYSKDLFDDTPVFFCGVNTLEAHNLEGAKNFYGVVEKSSTRATVEVALRQNSNIENIYLIVDDTITGRSTKNDVTREMTTYYPELNFEILENMTIGQIESFLGGLNPENTIAIHTFYVVDVDGSVYPLNYTAQRFIEASAVPVYALYDFGFGEGAIGGKIVEGYSQGTRVAEMAAAYLEDPYSIRDKYIVDDSYNRYKFDYMAMQKYDLSINALPETSIIINRPTSFYEKHKMLVNVSLIAFFLLIIYVVILRLQIASQTIKITKTQKELMESEKMASLGRLVAGVAHEVNTPVGVGVTLASHIENTTNIVLELTRENQINKNEFIKHMKDLKTTSNHLLSTLNRASDIIRSFKKVSVDQVSDEYREINVCSYLYEILGSLQSEIKRHAVDISVICDENITVKSHPGGLYQIFLNLIMNSINHGFKDRSSGIIEISLSYRKDKEGSGRNTTYKEAQDVLCIKYRDYGVGMDPATLKKLYEPFFTTKRDCGGSGLGMNIVYNLVTQRFNGTIKCSSAVNAGTEFEIELLVDDLKPAL